MEKYIQNLINELKGFGETTQQIWEDLQSILNTSTELEMARDLLGL